LAKKKTVSSKKKPSTVKKTTASKKKTPSVRKKTPVVNKQSAKAVNRITQDTPAHEQNIPLLPVGPMEDYIEGTRSNMKDFEDITRNNLTDLQRRRKIGAGTRNYGFIDKVSDLAVANPDYAHFFNLNDLKNCIRNVEMCRDLYVLLL
jgi:hypothetical protein